MANVFIIDDDEIICQMIAKLAQQFDHEAHYALTLAEGIGAVESGSTDIIFLDVNLPDGNGLLRIPSLRNSPNEPEIIIITGEGIADGPEMAIKYGAWDYLQKPLSKSSIELALSQVSQYRQNEVKLQPIELRLDGIIGSSSQMRQCYDTLARASVSDINVLIEGDTGTGKEVFARAIHENCSYTKGNFVVVDCATLSETLIESTLFGHKKGAFTDAGADRTGLIKEAHGGTLFLDEIGEMPLSMQKAFLRVLQERKFRPVGDTNEEQSNFRLIAATNRNMEDEVKKGSFREDLLHRIKGISLELSPLRERQGDIKELTLNYIEKICRRYKIEPKGLSGDFLESLLKYDWPGNVRELIHSLEAAITQARHEPVLFAKHLPTHIRVQLAKKSLKSTENSAPPNNFLPWDPEFSGSFPSYQEFSDTTLVTLEKKYLLGLLKAAQGNISKASKISGLSRAWLYKLLKKHDISRKFQ